MVKRKPAALLLLLATSLVGCSKTEDTAPETRIFGDPPTIGSVVLEATTRHITCDVAINVQYQLCVAGGFGASMYSFFPAPPAVDLGYTEFKFSVKVTDPQSTPAQSDILLVTASFKTPVGQTEETSLILLNDQSEFEFPWKQTKEPLDLCTSVSPPCQCDAATYELSSNDADKTDDIFTRGFGFVAPAASVPINGFGVVESCLARVAHQAPFSAGSYTGRDVPFKIEATDRAGSITEWPEQPVGHVGETTWDCTGDLCACCIAFTSDPSECADMPGLISNDNSVGWPAGTGFCEYVL